MAQTNVLLREDVEHLGARGEIVKVKAGYARNYLLPRKLAVEATPACVTFNLRVGGSKASAPSRSRGEPRGRPRV